MKNILRKITPIPIKNWMLKNYFAISERLFSDKQQIKRQYRWKFNKEINFNNPETFNEKIQILKLYHRPKELIRLVDKYEVRQYVKECGLEHILNQLIGIYDRVEDINLDILPQSFVMKVTHGSSWNIICRNKDDMDWSVEFKKLNNWLHTNYYRITREWVYKRIKPRIIIEKYLHDNSGTSLTDYKIFCFHSEPKFIQVDIDRFTNHKRNLYDLDWKLLPCQYNKYKNCDDAIARPPILSEMLEIARKLSHGLLFDRVDLYSIENKIIFGEITFFPENGFGKFDPEDYDLLLGANLDISTIRR